MTKKIEHIEDEDDEIKSERDREIHEDTHKQMYGEKKDSHMVCIDSKQQRQQHQQ